MDQMQAVAETIVKLRQQYCPRTSYATAGTAASTIFALVPPPAALAAHSELLGLLLASKEFEHVEACNSIDEIVAKVFNHVVLLFCPSASSLPAVQTMLLKQRSKLCIVISSEPAELTNLENTSSANHISMARSMHGAWEVLALFLSRDRQQASDLPLVAFNGQPSAQSRSQFKYLWKKGISFEGGDGGRQEAKQRVLQRLADKALANQQKLSQEDWDGIISKELTHGDDWHVYSRIRQVVLGRGLDEDIAQPAAPAAAAHGHADEGEGDGRANHLVDLTIGCLPSTLKVRRLLDYGCAEGAITAELGRRLGLKEDAIFGADVRAITANKGYTFLQLPAEHSGESILPSLADGSVDLINAAMVFHHVTYIEAALQELRRKISPQGALIIREHDCHTVAMGAMLDIVHGLFSLSWSDPIEWPDFLSEYQAFYRNRDQWTELLVRNGFMLAEQNEQASRQYNAAKGSVLRNNRFPNVIRAYYAVYVPDPSYKVSSKRGSEETAGHAAKRARLNTEGPAASKHPNLICESKTHPGCFYLYNRDNKSVEWIS